MSDVLKRVQQLVERGAVRVSAHGYDELAADTIRVRDVLEGLPQAVVVEDYPTYPTGPCVLVLQRDGDGEPIQ